MEKRAGCHWFKQVLLMTVAVSVFVLSDLNSASAISLVTTDPLLYSSNTGGALFSIDFNGSPGAIVPGNSFSSEVSFGSPEASDPATILWSSNAISDAGSTTASNNVGPISGVFTDPVYAFSFYHLGSNPAPFGEVINLYDASNNLIASWLPEGVPGPVFAGMISDIPIKSFVIVNGIAPPGIYRNRFFIDDFSANAPASVPEPSSLILLGSGLAGLVALRRRIGA